MWVISKTQFFTRVNFFVSNVPGTFKCAIYFGGIISNLVQIFDVARGGCCIADFSCQMAPTVLCLGFLI